MKIFISWSGERSRQVAELLADWIQCVIQAVEPWISTKDIERGSQWFTEITGQLSSITIGIVCLTKENKNKPWILFEAGAIAKGLSSSRVCTFLVDLQTSDIENPLAQFNHTIPNKSGLWALVSTVNNCLSEAKLSEQILDKVFNTYWPQFEQEFHKILTNTPEEESPVERGETDIMIEVLNTVRGLDKRIRAIENPYIETINSEIIESIPESNLKQAREEIIRHIKLGFRKDQILKIMSHAFPRITIKALEAMVDFEFDKNKNE